MPETLNITSLPDPRLWETLTGGEQEAVRLYGSGLTAEQTSKVLFRSKDATETRIQKASKKLGVANGRVLARFCQKYGFLATVLLACVVLAQPPAGMRATAAGLLVESPSPFVVQAIGAVGQSWDCQWQAFDAMPEPVRGGGPVTVLIPHAALVYARFYELQGLRCDGLVYGGPADFDCDGDIGTDRDIAAFFACLADNCPSADFNDDGDRGTDVDVECFFVVIGGGSC